jgi:hypothetical protein
MPDVLSSIIALLFLETVSLYLLFKYDRKPKRSFDKDVTFSSTANINSILALPFFFYFLFFIPAVLLLQNKTGIHTIAAASCLPALLLLVFISKRKYKTYLFTETGIEVHNLINGFTTKIEFNNITEAGFKEMTRGASGYFINYNGRSIQLDALQMPRLEKVKTYFTDKNIPFYMYDSFYGTYKKV